MILTSLTRTQFEAELENLRQKLLEMGSGADHMLALSMQALTEQNETLAEEVIALDDQIDIMDLDIEAECIRLIALQQPIARDLRLIGTAFKAITDIERIGDFSVCIAKVARRLAKDTFYKPLVDLPRMASMVRGMLKDVLTSFVNHDLQLAHHVVDQDDEVDILYDHLRDELYAAMKRDPNVVIQASAFLFVAHYLERIADHSVNIAERVHYVETGDLVQLARSHKSRS
jgi:phosphate transport system protein